MFTIEAKTLGQVLIAQTEVPVLGEGMAREALRVLAMETERPVKAIRDMHKQAVFFVLKVGDLAELMVDTQPSAHQAGAIVRGMGLRTLRCSRGYRVYWNATQLEILRKALGV